MADNIIFDDVFHTMVLKIPELVIPLINEVFKTDYVVGDLTGQQHNNFITKDGTIETDAIFMIRRKRYHLECQSTNDRTMAIRMFEYDTEIAIENAQKDGYHYRVEYPRGCILYLRSFASLPKTLGVTVLFPDDQEIEYSIPVINAQDYTEEEIFRKNLLMLLPFYILRYEKELPAIEDDEERVSALLTEYQRINLSLWQTLEENRSDVYNDLIDLIRKIAEYVLKKSEKLQERMDAVMGGKILELASERIRREVAEEYKDIAQHSAEVEKQIGVLASENTSLKKRSAEQAKQMDEMQETIRQLREQLDARTPAVQ